MIRFQCDRCERTIEVEDDLAGTKLECPDCGDMNIVPDGDGSGQDAGQRRASEDRAAAAGFPPSSGPEVQVVVVHPALMRANPLLFLGVVLAIAGGLGLVVWFGLFARESSLRWLFWPGVVLLVVASLALVVWKVQKMSHALVITTRRSIERRGLLSRSTSEVLHDNIRNIQIDQSFLERLLNVGTISISSAGQDGVEIQVEKLPAPDDIRKIIDLYREL